MRNVAPLPFGAPADKLPVPYLKLPKDFKVEVFASGIANARSMRLGDKGTVFVSNRLLDKVYAVVDKNGKREVKVIASGMDRPNGLGGNTRAMFGGATMPRWQMFFIRSATRTSRSSPIFWLATADSPAIIQFKLKTRGCTAPAGSGCRRNEISRSQSHPYGPPLRI